LPDWSWTHEWGILGAGGFSKTLTAYIVYFAATGLTWKTTSENSGAGSGGGFLSHSLCGLASGAGSIPAKAFCGTLAYTVIGTMVVGAVALWMLDNVE